MNKFNSGELVYIGESWGLVIDILSKKERKELNIEGLRAVYRCWTSSYMGDGHERIDTWYEDSLRKF